MCSQKLSPAGGGRGWIGTNEKPGIFITSIRRIESAQKELNLMKYYGKMKRGLCLRLRYLVIVIILPVLFAAASFAEEPVEENDAPAAQTSENGAWTGIDVSIVGKYAEKYGRPPREPYINTDKGDLILFVFTLAGVVGGFIIGFNARKLFYENKCDENGYS